MPKTNSNLATRWITASHCAFVAGLACSGNDVGHINKVTPRRARLVLGLVTDFGVSTIPVFSRPLRPTQPRHPSVGWCNQYSQWFRPPLGKKRRVLRSSEPCYMDCWHNVILYASLIGCNPRRLKTQRGWAPSIVNLLLLRRSSLISLVLECDGVKYSESILSPSTIVC